MKRSSSNNDDDPSKKQKVSKVSNDEVCKVSSTVLVPEDASFPRALSLWRDRPLIEHAKMFTIELGTGTFDMSSTTFVEQGTTCEGVKVSFSKG
jgi:hypothetical protein